jgi:hypothetical protein
MVSGTVWRVYIFSSIKVILVHCYDLLPHVYIYTFLPEARIAPNGKGAKLGEGESS